jgi:hypothetical protein
VPLAPETIVSQGVLACAVHAQLAVVVTVTLTFAPVALTVVVEGLI